MTRPRRSSNVIMAAGFVATALWSAFVAWWTELAPVELLVVVLTGGFTTAGCVGASIWQWRVQQATEEQLERTEHRAITDPLTGLLNRSGMFAELELAVEETRRSGTVMGVLFLDLDRFKVINDSMGHDVGDELLRVVASRLANTVRASDSVARFGGDEFVVVCRGLLSSQSVIQVARQILTTFSQPIALQGGSQLVSTSIGIAVADAGDDRRAADLVRDADAAMFTAKRNRSGFAVFDEVERRRAVDRHAIERDLRRALSDGELIVHYQPIVALPGYAATGFEALVRWNHPSLGLVGPSYFLEVAEDAALMSSIGQLVLREACAQMAVWNHLNPEARSMTMSVNLAEQQLLDATFVDQVAGILDWSGLPAEQLTLEITEGIIAAHLGELTVLRKLRELGVSFAIDDFGTGQSSLAVLRQLDMVSILKIDKEFVHGLRRGAADIAIVEAVVSMASALGLRVVAEGVESRWQLGKLEELGVRLIQGYLFNRPMAADDIRPGLWSEPQVPPVPRDGLSALEVSRELLGAPRSRSAPRPLRPRPVPGPGRS